MSPTLKDVLKTGGLVTLEIIETFAREQEELKKKLEALQKSERDLQDRLQQETLLRRSAEQELRIKETEITKREAELAWRAAEIARQETAVLRRRGPGSKIAEPAPPPAPAPPPFIDHEKIAMEKQIGLLLEDLKALQQRVVDAPREARNEERTRLFRGLGELMDSLGRAIQHSDGVWREGLLGIEAQFVSFFKSEGVEILGSIGEPMNPWLHNAIEISHDTDFQRGQIVQVLRPGFRLQDGAVLRHADVVVAA